MSVSAVLGANPEFDAIFNQTRELANNKKMESAQVIKNFNPNVTFEKYNANPEETKLYQGVTQTDATQMNNQALSLMNNSEVGSAILESLNQRPQYAINPESPDMQHSQLVQSQADNIIRGVTSQYIDCKPKQACNLEYVNKSCIRTKINKGASCTKNLIVNVMPVQNTFEKLNISIQAAPKKINRSITMRLDLATNKIISSDGTVSKISVNPTIPMTTCPALKVEYISVKNNDRKSKSKIKILEHPSCSNSFRLALQVTQSNVLGRPIDVTVNYRLTIPQSPIVHESWSAECNYYEMLTEQGICQRAKPDACSGGNETRIINDMPVTKACWSMQSTYSCNAPIVEDTCGTIEPQCEQIDSQCSQKVKDTCVAYQQTYRCPTQRCVNTADVICGDGQVFCLDGNCVDHSYSASEDFTKGVSALSATADASKQFNSNSQMIFTGHAQSCRDDAANFSNCCSKSGWGQDIHLAHCSDEEKALGVNHEKGLSVYVGRYCAHEVLGICVEHKEAYCVFDSKMARLVQEQGRANQLHLRFGKAEKPNCRGISATELQRIDLSRIDFSSMYADLNNKVTVPNLSKIEQKIQAQIINAGHK